MNMTRVIRVIRAHKKPKTPTLIHRYKSNIRSHLSKMPFKGRSLRLIKISAIKRRVSIAHDDGVWVYDFFEICLHLLAMELTTELITLGIVGTIDEDDVKWSSVILLYKYCAIIVYESRSRIIVST